MGLAATVEVVAIDGLVRDLSRVVQPEFRNIDLGSEKMVLQGKVHSTATGVLGHRRQDALVKGQSIAFTRFHVGEITDDGFIGIREYRTYGAPVQHILYP